MGRSTASPGIFDCRWSPSSSFYYRSADSPLDALHTLEADLAAVAERDDAGGVLGKLDEIHAGLRDAMAAIELQGPAVEGVLAGEAFELNAVGPGTSKAARGEVAAVARAEDEEVVAGAAEEFILALATAQAVGAVAAEEHVLARPAVEAGEKLGFLPGDIQAKVNPFLKPLYDALEDMMEPVQVRKYIENEIIEILPLAFMRGRTLNEAFIILDEAQNCTVRQMKTFLTRLGVRGKVVVTGDITQVDLPPGEPSGLIDVQQRLKGVKGVDFVYLTLKDIVRHRLVQDIVEAYDPHEAAS